MEEMGKEEMQEKNNANKMLKEKVEDKIQEILVKNGITSENVDYLGKLMDIHKDLQEEECLKKKEELEMRYSEYDEANYGRRGVPGTGRGRGCGVYPAAVYRPVWRNEKSGDYGKSPQKSFGQSGDF